MSQDGLLGASFDGPPEVKEGLQGYGRRGNCLHWINAHNKVDCAQEPVGALSQSQKCSIRQAEIIGILRTTAMSKPSKTALRQRISGRMVWPVRSIVDGCFRWEFSTSATHQ
ncbi:hypothetical protein MHYP_G00273970 [Metynnis hypsauchen]